MFQQDQWPFNPVNLREVIDADTLAVLESGCCERLKRSLALLDYDPATHGFRRIDSIHPRQRFESFCVLLRDDPRIVGGDVLCLRSDVLEAQRSLAAFRESGDPFRAFTCHMGLQDATYIIQLAGKPVALLFTGQYRPAQGLDIVRTRVAEMDESGSARLDDDARQDLLEQVERLAPAPPDIAGRFKLEAEHIQRIAEAEYHRQKYEWEQEFLNALRWAAQSGGFATLDDLRGHTHDLLLMVQTFCRARYAVFFASVQAGDTVLAPITSVGVPAAHNHLPHFNWKKAGLPVEDFNLQVWDITTSAELVARGIRGDNSAFFDDAACVLPVALGSRYRGALVLGPLAEPVDLARECRFLVDLCDSVGTYFFTALEMRTLEQERRRWRSTARLLTHQLRTALTPITTQIGRAKLRARKLGGDAQIEELVEMLQRAEDLCLRLAQGSRQTVEGYTLLLHPEDLEFETYSLSALVANCAEVFVSEAQKRHRQLIVDKSIERLPEAEIDVGRLTIALSNLIDNAIKYSFPNTKIYLRGSWMPDQASAVIEVDDLGDAIPQQEREIIFEEGQRGLAQARMGHIPGTGLGLWEARAVINAHGGEIGVFSKQTTIQRPQGTACQTVFSIKLPLKGDR